MNMYGNPYMNNNMYAPQQMQYTPYQQPIQQTNNTLVGKSVASVNDITANDVPMDSNFAIFPTNDLSEIQIRKWNAQGTIDTISYKPILDKKEEDMTNVSSNELELKIEPILTRLDGIEKSIQDLQSGLSQKTTSRTKKGV